VIELEEVLFTPGWLMAASRSRMSVPTLLSKPRVKRILIITADAGFGHRRAAVALCQALLELCGAEPAMKGSIRLLCQPQVINPLDAPGVPRLLRGTQSEHDQFARSLSGIYGRIWHASRARLLSEVIGAGLARILGEVFCNLLDQYQPDVIVSTYPLYHTALAAAFALRRCHIPVVTVVTDLGLVHRLWFHPVADACLVATETVRQQAIAFGMPSERIHLCGIPILPAFMKEQRAAHILRAELGWQTELTTILAVGSRRVPHLAEFISALNHSGLPIQLVVVAGGDEELFRALHEIEWKLPVRLYNWVEQMPVMLHAADCVVSKAGGLILAESLACGLPVLLVDVMPDQETGNVEYVLQNGAGDLASSPEELVVTLRRWLENGSELLHQRAERARSLGRPLAASQAAELIWRIAQSS